VVSYSNITRHRAYKSIRVFENFKKKNKKKIKIKIKKNIYKGVERRLWTTLINSEVMTETLAPEEINGSGAIDREFWNP